MQAVPARAPRRRPLFELMPIYTMWLRDIIRFFRMRSRLIAAVVMPFILLLFMAYPMGNAFKNPVMQQMFGMPYLDFLTPGIVGMMLVMGAMMGGMTVIFDKEFGFLKEVLVTPVRRFSIITGRSLGGITVALMQAVIIVPMSMAFGVHIQSIGGFWLSVAAMILLAAAFIGISLVVATLIEGTEGFFAIMMLGMMPLLFCAPGFFPVNFLTTPVLRQIMFINPLTYGIDALRGCLVGWGHSYFPLGLDFGVLAAWTVVFMGIGVYLFGKMEAD